MKTPKRTLVLVPLNPEDWSFDPPHHAGDMLARWKRKNREKQLKRTIARLKREKEEAYHRGHQAGYDLCFARQWF